MSWTDSYELPYATVIGRFGSVVRDSLDPDLRPDINPLSGTITLTPTVPYIKINGTVLQIATITAQVVNGVVVNPDGSEGISILSTDVENDTITNWGWRATFKIPEVRITPVSFYAVEDEVIDLANLTSGITGLPIETVSGPKGDKGDPGEDGHTPEITFDGETIVIDGVPGPDLKGEPGDGGGGAGGIREVEGVVQLPTDGPRVLEIYTVGDTAIGPETFPVDTAVVARRRADGVWERWVVGYDSGWREFGSATPDPPRSVTPDAPEFVDLSGTAQDVTIIPAVTGVQYLIDGVPVASGSHPSSGTVTVDAIAAVESVSIEGTASWTHEFSDGIVQEWGTRAHHATFTQEDTGGIGIYHDPARPTEFPPVYTDESGGVWNGSAYNAHIRSNALKFTAGSTRAWVEHGLSGDVSVRATVTNGASGRVYAQVGGPLGDTEPRGIHMTFQGATMSLYTLTDSTSYNKDGGTGTTALIPDYDPATPYRLRLDVVGDQVMVFVDDVHYMTGTIQPSRITEAGGRRFLGLAGMARDVLVDDVEVWVP